MSGEMQGTKIETRHNKNHSTLCLGCFGHTILIVN